MPTTPYTDSSVDHLLDFLARDRPEVAREAIAYLRDNAAEARYHDPAVGITGNDAEARGMEALADAVESALETYR